MNESHELELETADPIAFVEAMKAECSQMGRNDSEIPNLIRLQDAFRAGELSAAEVVERAREIRYGKQDH